jgi:GcrA cell cycle regulator
MWTEERLRLATGMWLEGHSASEIAKRLEVFSRCAIIGKMARMGVTHPGQTKEAKDQRKERARQASQIRERGKRRGNTGGALCQRVKAKHAGPPTKPSLSVPYTPIGLSVPFLDLAKDQCHAPMENGQLRCGHKVHTKDYCEAHAALFYRRVA